MEERDEVACCVLYPLDGASVDERYDLLVVSSLVVIVEVGVRARGNEFELNMSVFVLDPVLVVVALVELLEVGLELLVAGPIVEETLFVVVVVVEDLSDGFLTMVTERFISAFVFDWSDAGLVVAVVVVVDVVCFSTSTISRGFCCWGSWLRFS